jgi:hypothetical protein
MLAQTIAIIGTLAILIGIQSFWISRSLDRIDRGLERIDDRLRTIETDVLGGHGERIARLERTH